jgi:hypothetical protein
MYTESINEMASAVSHVSGIGCLAEVVMLSTLNLIPHPAGFGTSMVMQEAQNIHFQKCMMWGKT